MTDLAQQIRELYERDQRNRSPAVRATELPLAYELTTPEWWTDVLCQKHKGAKVVSYTLDEPDDGSAQRRRVFLEYNAAGEAAGLPASVFCKASHSLRHRINLGVSGAAHSEVSFYRHIRPEMALEIPEAYFAAYDPDSFNSMVVLSDIGDEVEFCRHWTNIDRRRVEGQVQLMARYHAGFFDDQRVTTEFGLPTWPQFFGNCSKNRLEEACAKGFRAAESVIPARLFKRDAEVWQRTLESVDAHTRLPGTLLHGDCHLKQWYIRDEAVMGLTDWQCSSFGNWARDYAYAIATSLRTEDRRNWEKELLKLYLDSLAAAGGQAPSFDEAWKLYRTNLMSALAWWTVTLTPDPELQPDMQPVDTTLEFIGRISHAVDDLDVLDAFD